jgi:hypothetical protein
MTQEKIKKAEGLLYKARGIKGKIQITYEGGITIYYLDEDGRILTMGCGATELEALQDAIKNACFIKNR